MQEYIYIVTAVVFLIIIYFIHSMNKNKAKEIELERDRLELTVKLDLESTEILDKLIMDTFDEYRLLNLSYNNDYINKDREEEILKEVSDLVSERLSVTFIKQMSLYYNPSVIPNIISKKIYLTVMKYVIEHNAIKE